MKNFQDIILVHYHEIGLKGHNRISFEMRLLQNLQSLFDTQGIKYTTIKRISGRLCIFFPEIEVDKASVIAAYEICKTVPGIARVSRGYRCAQNLESMIEAGKVVMSDAIDELGSIESFKVSGRRNHTDFEHNSMEINQIVGGALSEAYPDVAVKMKNPTCEVHVEVIQAACYVYGTSASAVGGLPVGTAGKVVGMMSSGIDSPVALWKLARRGAIVIGVHFSGAPVVANTSEYLVKEIGELFEKSGCIAKIYTVRVGKFQKHIAENSPEKIRIILYRRLMYKIAQAIANKEQAGALVTGESLGQVASQTLENLAATDDAVGLPVLRPLIGSDKLEIINRAKKIGTFDISSVEAPDCCTLYMPSKPETHANIGYVRAAEQDFPYEQWIDEALESADETTFVCPSYKKSRAKSSVS